MREMSTNNSTRPNSNQLRSTSNSVLLSGRSTPKLRVFGDNKEPGLNFDVVTSMTMGTGERGIEPYIFTLQKSVAFLNLILYHNCLCIK